MNPIQVHVVSFQVTWSPTGRQKSANVWLNVTMHSPVTVLHYMDWQLSLQSSVTSI